MAKVELKKIVPIQPEDKPVLAYEVHVEVDGKPKRPWDIQQPNDFTKFQANVLHHTGYTLDPEMGKDWATEYTKYLTDPQEPPEGWDDITCEDDSPLTKKEEKDMPDEFKETMGNLDRQKDEDWGD